VSLAEKVYQKSPVFLQNALLSAYGLHLYRLRFRGNFERRLGELLQSERFSAAQLLELQRRRLAELTRLLHERVPHYRDHLKSRGATPEDITLENFSAVFTPVTKADINRDPRRFLAEGVDARDLVTINTSGTSGSPLTFYTTPQAVQENYAFFARFLRWAGVRERLRSATFAGRIIIPQSQESPPFWRKNLVMRNQLFSSYHLSPRFLGDYVRELDRFAPEYIDSYPSAIYTLATFMLEHGLKLRHPPRAVVTSSETLLDYQRTAIEAALGCRVFDQYGNAEAVSFIAQCEHGSYHVNPEYGIVEIVDADGRPCAPGEVGELVCTGFLNTAMPLVRYRIGDTASFASGTCACGRHFPLMTQIEGRVDDMIITPEGNRVGRLDPIFKGLAAIRETQIVQESLERLVVRIVPGKGFDLSMAERVVAELRKRVGERIGIEVEILQEIPRTRAGKFRAVVSHLKAGAGAQPRRPAARLPG